MAYDVRRGGEEDLRGFFGAIGLLSWDEWSGAAGFEFVSLDSSRGTAPG